MAIRPESYFVKWVRRALPGLLGAAIACSEGCGPSGSSSAVRPRLPPHLAIVVDRSVSMSRSAGGCGAITALVEQALNGREAFSDGAVFSEYKLAPGSAIYPYFTGESDVSEPLTLQKIPYPDPQTGGVEDREVIETIKKTNIKKVIDSFHAACSGRQVEVETKHSPVYLAVRAAADSLGLVCGQDRACLLVVISDLADTGEPSIKQAIAAIKAGRPVAESLDIRPIELDGRMAVHLCGTGQSSESKNQPIRDSITGLWKDRILKNSKKTVITAACLSAAP